MLLGTIHKKRKIRRNRNSKHRVNVVITNSDKIATRVYLGHRIEGVKYGLG